MATRNIYIDSRQAQGTGAYLTLTLKQSVQVPENTVAYMYIYIYIVDVFLPDTSLTVDANRCYIYISDTYSGITLRFMSHIPHGNLRRWTWLLHYTRP